AYFAAKDAARWALAPDHRPDGCTHLSIWALNLNFVFAKWPADLILRRQEEELAMRSPVVVGAPKAKSPGRFRKTMIIVVTAPRASNPNLHAQGGLFTVYRKPNVRGSEAFRPQTL